jgi:hypothetical protein
MDHSNSPPDIDVLRCTANNNFRSGANWGSNIRRDFRGTSHTLLLAQQSLKLGM